MNRVRFLPALGAAATLALCLALPVPPVQGQVGQLGNSAALEKSFSLNKGRFFNYYTAKEKPDPKIIDEIAQYFVYKVNWPISDAALPAHVQEFHKNIDQIVYNRDNKVENKDFIDLYGQALTRHFRELTKLPVTEAPKAVLYGGQMIPQAARLRHDSFGNYLAELINEKSPKPGHDAVRFWAIRGLREFFPVASWGEGSFDFSSKVHQAKKKVDTERVEALTKFIERKAPDTAAPDELAAFNYLRREAIESMAQAGAPAVNAHKKSPQAEGLIAPVLLKAIVPGGLNPPTTLAERNEAALGLCEIRPVEEYVPAPTVYFIGKTLVEMVKEYNGDSANIVLKSGRNLPTTFPWRIIAKRWELGLAALKATTSKDNKAVKQAADLESRARPLLKEMYDSKQLSVPAMLGLEKYVSDLAPKAGPIQVFKSIKAAPVNFEPEG